MENQFVIEDLPFVEMQKVGLIKKTFFELKDANLLMCGKKTKTCIECIKLHGGSYYKYHAHVSLKRTKKGTELAFHPIIDSFLIDDFLTPTDRYNLASGFPIGKTLCGKDGIPQVYILQLSRKNGGLLKVPLSSLKLPKQIGNINLTKPIIHDLFKRNSHYEKYIRSSYLTIGIDLNVPGYFFTRRESYEQWKNRKLKFIKYSMPLLFHKS